MPAKLDGIVKALKREHPDWSESKIWKIAQTAYKKWKRKMHGKR